MDKRKQTNKTLFIAFAIILVVLIVIIALPTGKDKPVQTSAPTKEWSEMTYEDREEWINNYMNHPDDKGRALIETTKKAIENQLSHPQTVKYNVSPSFSKDFRNIVEADSGWVFTYGKGTADNSFGVPVDFNYSVKWKITPNELKIIDISVTEDK